MSELNIPESWAKATFKEIFSVNPRNKIDDDKLEVSFVPMNSVNQYTAKIESEETRSWGKVKKGYTHFRNGDVIFAKITPCMENKKSSLAIGLKNGFAVGSTEFHVLRPSFEFDPKFILHFVRSGFFLKEAADNMSGTAGQKRVPTTWLNEYPFPIPPKKEQQRIVQKIESCFEKIESTEKNLQKVEVLLEKYRESLLAKAFRGELIPQDPNDEPASVLLAKIREEREKDPKNKRVDFKPISDDEKPFEIPKGWEWVRLESFVEIQSGMTPKDLPLKSDGIDFSFIKVSDMNNSVDGKYINSISISFSKKTIQNFGLKTLPKGTIIFPKRGGAILTNKKRILATDSICDTNIMGMIVPESIREYVWLWFQTVHLGKLHSGSTIPQINNGDVFPLFIPIPPLKEQDAIISFLNKRQLQLVDLAKTVKSKISLIAKMKESILQKAFEGRLVEQIESEGTGHELLTKILAQKEISEQKKEKKDGRKKK